MQDHAASNSATMIKEQLIQSWPIKACLSQGGLWHAFLKGDRGMSD